MRVIAANNYYYLRGGSERVFFSDMQALRDRGIEVVPFSAADPANDRGPYTSCFPRGVDTQTARPLSRMRAALEAIYCRRTANAFAELVKRTAPHLVHCHNIYGRLTTSLLNVADRLRVPVVLTVHDYKLICPSYLMLRGGQPCDACVDGGYYRCLVHRCHKASLASSAVYAAEAYFTRFARQYAKISAFLCPSGFMAGLLKRAGFPPDRVIHHPNCVDPNAYAPSFQPGEYVLYAGRLSAEKGVVTLLQAILSARIPIRIAGGGPMAGALRDWIAQHPAANVVLEGHCDGERLRQLYQNAAFVVVPSEWYENAPMSVIEAFAYGKAVIASSIGGLPELVIDGETGYLFPCGDQAHLEVSLCRLWSNRNAQQRMGQNARRLVETQYSQSRRMDSLIGYYDRICRAGV